MENKELEKNAPVELEDDALDNVSGGFIAPIIATLPFLDTEMGTAPGKKEFCANCTYVKSDRDTGIFGKLLDFDQSDDICKNCPYEQQEKTTKVTI